MMTHAEFRRAAWRHWGGHLARVLSAFTLGAFVFAALWFLLEAVEPAEPAETRAEIAMAVAIAAALARAVISSRSAGSEVSIDERLLCPQCGRHLGYYYVPIVLHSGNCPHCGDRVLED
jgi:predicted RNA-binding Zn-ribbon protein involved in translation (DUF1610 family)